MKMILLLRDEYHLHRIGSGLPDRSLFVARLGVTKLVTRTTLQASFAVLLGDTNLEDPPAEQEQEVDDIRENKRVLAPQ